jgi:DNA gyrase subunit A
MIEDKRIEDILAKEYLTYAGYVLKYRAIPDSRDCLKDGARKILYAQQINGITHDKAFKKGTKNVAAAMSFSVHGSGPIYGNLVRMAQPFALRYPLEDFQGNVGSLINLDDYAADRYLELRSSAVAAEMLKNIKKETIEKWRENYDQTDYFPTVLPGYFPNIVNGCTGIGVGASCSIPQFNIGDVCAALVKLVNNPQSTFEDIYCPVDFATGGIITNEEEVKLSLREGKGKSIKIIAKMEYDSDKNEIVVKELPYQVCTSTICEQLNKSIAEGKISGIESYFDGTDYNGVAIRIRLTKTANVARIIDRLYKETSLGYHYPVNMVMLEEGRFPRVFGWREALVTYLKHLKNTIRRSYEFDLRKILDRIHILTGLIKAIDIIDDVIRDIKASANTAVACVTIMKNYSFTELQAKAILDMKLQKLAALEKEKLVKELKELELESIQITELLNSEEKFNKEVIREIESIKNKFKDDHRTLNTTINTEEENEPLEKKNLVVYISEKGAILATEATNYLVQNRGGKGSKIKLKNNDFIKETIYTSNGDMVLLFSNKGKAYIYYLNDLEIGKETHLNSILEMEADEKIVNMIPYNKNTTSKYVVFGTINGIVKKTELSEYISKKRTGMAAIKLKDGDSLAVVQFIKEKEEIMLISANGNGIKFKESEITSTGRNTMGVKGINLNPNDHLVAIVNIPLEENIYLCSITSNGMVKQTDMKEFSNIGRGGKGVNIHKLKDATEYIVDATFINQKTKEVLVATSTNIIKISVNDIPISGRTTIGNKAINGASSISKLTKSL